MFLGEDLLAWLVLAMGGALAGGTALALIRPPAKAEEGDLSKAPIIRSMLMITVGAIAAVWALATLAR